MTTLIILLFLLFVLLLVLAFNSNIKASENRQKLEQVTDTLEKITNQLNNLQLQLKPDEKQEEKVIVVKNETPAPAVPEPIIQPLPVKEKTFSIAQAIRKEEEEDERSYSEENVPVKENTDLERFIGENLANKIGIAVLVLGISFFVKYAIDKNWINETGRVIIGLLCGGTLIGIAHYVRNNYRSFSSVLVGGGLTVFYFTIAFAFHQYHLIGQQAAFIIMTVISAFAVLLSLFYNRRELAILATIGGFITPFLVSTGQDNYVALFTYLCILNTALMVLAWFKRWPAINIIALFFTTVIYGGWLIKRTVLEDADTLPRGDAFLFATIFYILFIVMNIINSLRLNRKFMAFDFIIVFSINFLYYAAAFVILDYHNSNYQGIFTAALGIANLLTAAFFYRRKAIDRNFISLLIGLSLTFISLTAPIQFEGNHIVLFWASESVVLFWLYQRARIIHLKVTSFFVSVLTLVTLVITWTDVYMQDIILPVIANKGFVTSLAAGGALFIYYLLLRKEKEEYYLKNIPTGVAKNRFLAVAIAITYLGGAFEIYYQFATRYPGMAINAVYLQAYTFAIALLLLQVFRKTPVLPRLKFLFSALCAGLYLVNLRANYTASVQLLTDGPRGLFAGHWIAAILLFWLLADLVRFFFKSNNERWTVYQSSFTWLAAASIVFLLSAELYQVILWTKYRTGDWEWWENLYYKAGLTILWGMCSFIMMWMGMRYGFRTIRIISLSLFTITLVKLFAYDIRNIPPGGKIAAFILLGVLLLIVSFMYQRLKKIIIDDSSQ